MSQLPPSTPTLPPEMPDELRKRFMWLGYALILIGALSIIFPLMASIAAKLMLGWFFLISGAVILYHAFQSRDWSSALWSGAIGVLNLAVGAYLAFLPLSGLIGLTALMGISFLVQGAFEAAMANRQKPKQGWGWLMFSGVASALLGILLIAGLPGTALWALGLMMGINLLTSGMSFVALARHGVE